MAIRPGDWGPYSAPALVILYGESNTGKTTACLRACPTGFFFGPSGAFSPSYSALGFSLHPTQTRIVSNLWEALDALAKCIAENNARPLAERRPAVTLDDLSLLVANTVMLMKDSGQYTKWSAKLKADIPDVWGIYGEISAFISRFCYYARNAGMHAFITGHEADAFTDDDGKFWKGGISVGSKNQTKKFPYHGDLVLRARPGAVPAIAGAPSYTSAFWPAWAECIPDSDYYEKDRFTIAPTKGPMNPSEMLRLAGYRMERLSGLEWLDDQVGIIAEKLSADAAPVGSAAFEMHRREWNAKLLSGKMHPKVVDWAMQDACDRIDMVRRKRVEMLARMGVSNGDGGAYAAIEVAAPVATTTSSLGGGMLGGKL